MNKTLNQLRDEIHANAVEHGFYDNERHFDGYVSGSGLAAKHAFFAQKIALIHSELSEALEADRSDRLADMTRFEDLSSKPVNPTSNPGHVYVFNFDLCIKNTVEDELCDAIIRILDLCGHMEIDIEKHIELKMKYNKLREYKHEKNY